LSGGDRKLLGRWGEATAAEYLRARGYKVIASGWRCRFGEIDLICTNEKYICFTEVKLRKNDTFAPARESVTAGKQRRLKTAAELYLSEHQCELQPRFDIAEVYAPEGVHTARPVIHYLENAFWGSAE